MATTTKSSRTGQAKVQAVMHEFKEGSLKSSSGGKVKNPKQAIAIALSEARAAGAPIPPKPASKKSAAKKTAVKKGAVTKTAGKKASVKKATKKSAAKKTAAKR